MAKCDTTNKYCSPCDSDEDCSHLLTDSSCVDGRCKNCKFGSYDNCPSGEVCLPGFDVCGKCQSHFDCNQVDGSKCSDGECVGCTSDAFCNHLFESGKGYCDETQGKCYECQGNADCSATEVCYFSPGINFGGSCMPKCSISNDCETTENPKCDTNAQICVPCDNSEDCQKFSSSKVCYTAGSINECRECQGSSECNNNRGASRCDRGYCAGCLSESDCQQFGNSFCQTSIGKCQAIASCSSNQDCKVDQFEYCDLATQKCASGCLSDSQCDQTTAPFCFITDHVCVQCLSNSICMDPAASRCSSRNICQTCTNDSDCSHIEGVTHCSRFGVCVQCLENADCTSDEESSKCLSDYTCGPCENDGDCSSFPLLPMCLDGKCKKCTKDSECPFIELARCFSSKCNKCQTDDKQNCEHFKNTQRCEENKGVCVSCVIDSDCTSYSASRCDSFTNECKTCTKNSQCSHIEDHPYCFSGFGCGNCFLDKDCPEINPVCSDNICVNPDGDCPDGTYFKEETLQCIYCDEACATCTGSDSSQCLECTEKYEKIEGKCLEECKKGAFRQTSSSTSCSTSCPSFQKRDPPDSGYCVSCESLGLMKDNSNLKCTEGCSSVQYFDASTNSCHSCTTGCLSCQDGSSCLKCESGFGLTEGKACEVCKDPCLDCSRDIPETCLKCSSSTYLQSGVCLSTTCSSNQFYDRNNTFKCLSCSQACSGCTGSTSKDCKSCAENYFYSFDQDSTNCSLCGNPVEPEVNETTGKSTYYAYFTFSEEKNACVDVCGDGRRFTKADVSFLDSYIQCDDGNLENGDGCSSECKVEEYWECSGGSSTSPDTCLYNKYPIAKIKTIADDASFLEVSFDESVSMPDDFSGAVDFSIPDLVSTDYKFSFEKESSVKFRINLSIYKSLINGKGTIEFIDPEQFKNSEGLALGTKSLVADLPDIEEVLSEAQEQAMSVAGTSATSSSATIIVTSAMIVSAPAAVQLLVVIEKVIYLMFLNVSLPKITSAFMSQFIGILPLKILPQPFSYLTEWLNVDEDMNALDFPEVFDSVDFNPLYLDNLGASFTIAFVCLVLLFISKLLVKKLNRKSRVYKWSKKIKSSLEWGFFLGFFEGTYIDFVYASSMQLRLFSTLNTWFLINAAFAGLGVIMVIVIPFFFLSITNQPADSLTSKSFEEKWGFCYHEFKLENFTQRNFTTISIFKNLLFVGFIIMLFDFPFFQVVLTNVVSTIWCIFCIKAQPYKQKRDNVKLIISEVIFILASNVITILLVNDYFDILSSFVKEKVIGISLLVLLLVIIIYNVGLMLIDAVKSILEMIQRLRAYFKRKKIQREIAERKKKSQRSSRKKKNIEKEENPIQTQISSRPKPRNTGLENN